MTYLFKTEYAIATIGSTKVGGNYDPKVFHDVLSENGTWGDAYKSWYNNYGIISDKWFLGMVILGDPMLVPSKGVQKDFKSLSVGLIPPGPEEIEELHDIFEEFAYDFRGDSFEDYKSMNPQFFNDLRSKNRYNFEL